MAERDSNDGSIEFKTIGGLNQRPSPNALPPPDMAVLHGMYPGRDGWMQRLPGTTLITAMGAPIWNIAQMDDGTGNIVVQTSDGTEILFTLAEIMGRDGDVSELVFNPAAEAEEDGMDMAIILQKKNQGTDGGAIGAALNTFYSWELTDNPTNEGTIVKNFNTVPNTFELDAGSYRIEIAATVCMSYSHINPDLRTCTMTLANPCVVTNVAHGLSVNDAISFSTTGALPATVVSGNTYFVTAVPTADTFNFSATRGGANVSTATLTQSGVHSLRGTAKDASAVAALYNETDATVVGTLTPAEMQHQIASVGGNPNFPISRDTTMHGIMRATLAGTKRFSVKVAGASFGSQTLWTANTDARGKTHGVTATLGGAALTNRYLVIKIVKEP